MEEFLIGNTTKEMRKLIIEQGLKFASIDNLSSPNTNVFDDYFNGKKELEEIYKNLIQPE